MTKTRKVPCEVYSRIVGYLRPVQNWNAAKKLEFKDRRTYDIPTTGRLNALAPLSVPEVPDGPGPSQ